MPAVPSPDFGAIAKEAGINTANGLRLVWQALNSITPTVVPSVTIANATDYAAGSWTPIDASGAGLVFTLGAHVYIKIGKMVFATFDITYPATASGLNSLIGGLPFTAANETTAALGGHVNFTNVGTPFTISVVNNSTQFNFWAFAGTNMTNALLSGSDIRGMVVYQSA